MLLLIALESYYRLGRLTFVRRCQRGVLIFDSQQGRMTVAVVVGRGLGIVHRSAAQPTVPVGGAADTVAGTGRIAAAVVGKTAVIAETMRTDDRARVERTGQCRVRRGRVRVHVHHLSEVLP